MCLLLRDEICCWARRGDQAGSLGDEVEVEGGWFSQVLVLGTKQPYSPDRRSRGQSLEISLWGAWRGCTGMRRPRARGEVAVFREKKGGLG